MILSPIRLHPLKRTTAFLMLVIVWQSVNSEPQNPDAFENVASQSLAMVGNLADMAANAGLMTKNMAFEMPFVKAKSESKVGSGAALRQDDDDADSSEEDRRKRAVDLKTKGNSLTGEEFLLNLPLNHQLHHFHRGKRSPCHTYGGGSTGGGGGGGVPTDGAEIDAERRRRAYARRRKAAAKKATGKKTTTTGSRKKKLVSDDDEDKQVLERRRKRQTELDDLNQSTSNDFAQYAQQIADQIRRTFDNLLASMHEMAQKLKQHFSGQNATNTMEI